MKAIVATILAVTAALMVGAAQAQPRPYDQAELDTMIAPIALHPDGLVSQILIASTYPEEVELAAGWSRANAHLRGEDAVRAVQNEPWDPAVKALVAFPELLARMAESPQWLSDLGQAFIGQQAQVMDTVQALRRRAQGTGNLASNDRQLVYEQGQEIIVQPRTQVVYVPYYDPYVVYGPWWWAHYHPVYWSPWVVRPVFLSHGFFYAKPYWRHHHVHVVNRPVYVAAHQTYVKTGEWAHRSVAAPHAPVRQFQSQPQPRSRDLQPRSREFQRVPESQRRPIANSTPLQAAASSPTIRQQVRESVRESARDVRVAPRQQQSRAQSAPAQPRAQGAPVQPRAQGVPAQPRAQAIAPQSHGMPAASGFSNHRPQGQARGQQQGQGRGHRQ